MHRFFILISALMLTLNSAARQDTLLDSGWHFKSGDILGAEAVDFSDTNWQTISIPHSWGWEEAQQGKDYYRGPGWYRRELDLKPQAGKRCFLRFEAASLFADVYLNGDFLGEHRGGFGAFCFEITGHLAASGTNVIAVRVSNSWEPDIAPLSGDFSVYGGLYRPVHLIETADENFTPTDHGSPGVAWLQTSVTKKKALLDMTAQISNGTRNNQSLTLVATVFDASGKKIAETKLPVTLAANTTAPYWLRVTVPHPHLWNGRPDPYLYQAVVELRSTNGIVDSVAQSLGLRFYRVDPDKGFFLNGKPYALYGVDRHQDRWNKGWAISEADMDEDMRLIQEIGATVVRCAHYEHSDYFYSLCDKAGILVWAEIPQVNEINASARFAETSRGQLLDLIRQNVNHPSIFTWSLFNEIGLGKTPDPERELQDLNNLAHSEDPTRPTIGATCTDRIPQMNKIPDLLGWNIYPGWYAGWGNPGDIGKLLDKHRYDSQHGGFCVSEYGAGANPEQHEQNPAQPDPGGQWHPEEWQAMLHETIWPIMKSKPYVWGTFVWNMFDFAVSTRHEGNVPGRNDKGLVTYDRKTKKDAFYFYKANWSEEPVLYLAERRFTERTNAVTDVKIYSNAKTVELLLNGKSEGYHRTSTNCVFVWRNVALKPGENRVAARAERDGKQLSDACTWTLPTTTNEH
ncbi:MAG TPA: glycoside hydrolase family 2 TIM barrel-domain containing protein [Candidatus Limnocylindrales bacterium]|nr:glycoside hydrolase family 2 TIM barrel-domain containing protein [Candidatus Limnocylindrales bacterium]